MKEKLGLITMGEAPRDDVLPYILPFVSDFSLEHVGLLDNCSKEEIELLAPDTLQEEQMVSKLKDGGSATMAKRKLIPLLQEKINNLENQGCDIIWVMCTGEFSEIHTRSVLIEPDRLITGLLENLSRGEYCLGVLVPKQEQIEITKSKYKNITQVIGEAYSPYQQWNEKEVQQLGETFSKKNCDLIIMDCMGYTPEHKKMLAHYFSGKIIVSNQWIGSVVQQLS